MDLCESGWLVTFLFIHLLFQRRIQMGLCVIFILTQGDKILPTECDNNRNTSWIFPKSPCAEFPSITTEGSWRSPLPKRMNNGSVTSENPNVGTSHMSAPSTDAVSEESYTPTPFSQQEWKEWKQHEWASKGALLFILATVVWTTWEVAW